MEKITRTIVVGVIRNSEDKVLLCRMAPDRGVFPGQWGLPGGGIEPGETMEEALRREMNEELGINIKDIQPISFKDGSYEKSFADGSKKDIYMIFLLFSCLAETDLINLNDEFDRYEWVDENNLADYDMNVETRDTFQKLGII